MTESATLDETDLDEHHDEYSANDRTLLILFATETGTAQDAADRIARACRRIHFNCRVVSMNEYSPSDLISEHLVVFVVATTGSGVEPRSMTPLWNMLLRLDLSVDLFDHLDFCVFGLGDSAYEKFCWPAKKLSRRMTSLGGREICVRGDGDEQHQFGIDGALDPWLDRLLQTLLHLYPLPQNLIVIPETSLPPARVSIVDSNPNVLDTVYDPLTADKNCHTAILKCNKRITGDDWFQDVRHFEFSFDHDIQYSPGDVAIIYPEAEASEVDFVLTLLGWANIADELITIRHTLSDQTFPSHIPPTLTFRTLFTKYLDFNAVPRRRFFELLRFFVTDELEKEKLEEFLSVEGADDLYDYCQRVKRTIREVLTEFRSVHVPREYLFDLFPPMRPRQFSIASSLKSHPREVHLCIAVVKYKTKLKIPRKGVCTSFLAALQPGMQVRIGIERGFITLPSDPHTPVICVGPGTGVAPMRAIIEERVAEGAQAADSVLYFGCRSFSKDQHYRSDWTRYSHCGQLTYRLACSREGPTYTSSGVSGGGEGSRGRLYVQHLIVEDGKLIWEMVGERQGHVIVSGLSNKMPAAVRQAVRDAVQTYGGKSREEAEAYVNDMERAGRLIEECWS